MSVLFQKKDEELEKDVSIGVGTCHATLGMFIGKFFVVDWRAHVPDTLDWKLSFSGSRPMTCLCSSCSSIFLFSVYGHRTVQIQVLSGHLRLMHEHFRGWPRIPPAPQAHCIFRAWLKHLILDQTDHL